MKIYSIYIWVFLVLVSCNGKQEQKQAITVKPLSEVEFSYNELSGIGLEKGITRRDPSDVIKVNNVCYVYYTKVIGRAAGYWGEIWYATSTDNGYNWKEEGRVLAIGKKDMFDSQAVFTPNIIKSEGDYYLFYTGVKPTPGRTDGFFENNSSTDITAIGVAVSKNPKGPFKRITSEPVLKVSVEPEKFDSYRIDDAALLEKNGKFYLYYKGRSRIHGVSGPGKTWMGIAISEDPEGPYKKLENPVLNGSHEVMIWKHGNGIAALASKSSTLEYAEDGVDFTSNPKKIKVSNRPYAPGAYRPDLVGETTNELEWGISMVHNGPDCYLVRYEVKK